MRDNVDPNNFIIIIILIAPNDHTSLEILQTLTYNAILEPPSFT